jgi:IMP cyclohydrolase
MDCSKEAQKNLEWLRGNIYPGRGLVMGMDETGENLVQIYWIMGRSENSRNRVFSHEAGRVFTEAADPAKVKDPSLIIYNAMCESHAVVPKYGYRFCAVSNGCQTDAIIHQCDEEAPLTSAMAKFHYEPDAPNFTPRISGLCKVNGVGTYSAEMSILRKSPWTDDCDRAHYTYFHIAPGFGYCLTTYLGDGDPLPSFHGEPLLMPIIGSEIAIMAIYWDALNKNNRVSLVVKIIPISGGPSKVHIVNRFEKAA